MLTERQDIDRAHRIAWASGLALWATVYPAVLAPLPAYGTRLRAVCLIYCDRASGLVIKLLNKLTGTGLAEGLRLVRCARCAASLNGSPT